MAFLDALQCEKVRQAFASGYPSFVLSSDGQIILWTNGAGAIFLKRSDVCDAINSPSLFDADTRRQVLKHAASGQPLFFSGLDAQTAFYVSIIDLNDQTCAVLLQASSQTGIHAHEVSLIAGLDDGLMSAAIVNGSGEVLEASPNFSRLDEAAIILLKSIDDYVPIKTIVHDGERECQIGVVRLSFDPTTFLILVAKQSYHDLSTQKDLATTAHSFPIQFVWKMDKDARFHDIAPIFIETIGAQYTDILGKSFADLALEWQDDAYLLVDEAIRAAKPWAKRILLWPVHNGLGRMTIEFSGLPVMDSDYHVQGYRGFGSITAFEAENTVLTKDEVHEEKASLGLSDLERSAFREIAQRLRSDLGDPIKSVIPVEPLKNVHENTQSKQAVLNESKSPHIETLLTLLDTATDGVIWLDEFGEIQSISSAACALIGYDLANLEITNLADIFSLDSSIAMKRYLLSMQNNGTGQIFNKGQTAHLMLKDGGLMEVFITLVPLSDKNGYAALLRDMTSKQDIQKPQEHSEETAKMVHEIRTPLNAIIGFAEIMRDGRFGAIENNRYEGYLRDIILSGKHILSLVNQVLHQAKSVHTLNHAPSPIIASTVLPIVGFDLKAALRGCVSLLENQANHNGIIMRVVLPSYIPSIAINEQSFRQVIWNLLSNAIRFTPAGGQVVINANFDGKRSVKISVSDNGIGMNNEEIAQALQLYGQVSRKDGRVGDDVFVGTGLGLPMTKAMVEENKGSFLLLSKPDRGTTIEMTFPVFHDEA